MDLWQKNFLFRLVGLGTIRRDLCLAHGECSSDNGPRGSFELVCMGGNWRRSDCFNGVQLYSLHDRGVDRRRHNANRQIETEVCEYDWHPRQIATSRNMEMIRGNPVWGSWLPHNAGVSHESWILYWCCGCVDYRKADHRVNNILDCSPLVWLRFAARHIRSNGNRADLYSRDPWGRLFRSLIQRRITKKNGPGSTGKGSAP